MTKPKTVPSSAAKNAPQSNSRTLLYVVGGVVVVALAVLLAISIANSESGQFEDDVIANASVQVAGTPLPLYLPDSGTNDQGLGLIAPEVTGQDFNGNTVSITHDGNPKLIVFLAHWCPHCQREVPVVQSWLGTNPLPDGVDLYSVATSNDPLRGNYPPSDWLAREGWTSPVIIDDVDSSTSGSFGLSAFPYWVFVDGDGTVLGRRTGGISAAELDQIVLALAAGTG